MKYNSHKRALEMAIKRIGGQSATADAISDEMKLKKKLRQSTIWTWLHKNKDGAPAKYCPTIEKLSEIPRHELRPDVFGGLDA